MKQYGAAPWFIPLQEFDFYWNIIMDQNMSLLMTSHVNCWLLPLVHTMGSLTALMKTMPQDFCTGFNPMIANIRKL